MSLGYQQQQDINFYKAGKDAGGYGFRQANATLFESGPGMII